MSVIFFTGAAELEDCEGALGFERGIGAFLTGAKLDVVGAGFVTGLRGEVVEAIPVVVVRLAMAVDEPAAPDAGVDVDLATTEDDGPATAVRGFEDVVGADTRLAEAEVVPALLAVWGFTALLDAGGTTEDRGLLDVDEGAGLERVAKREAGGGGLAAPLAAGGCVTPVVFEAGTVVFVLTWANELVVAAGFVIRVPFFGNSEEAGSGCFSSFAGSVTCSPSRAVSGATTGATSEATSEATGATGASGSPSWVTGSMFFSMGGSTFCWIIAVRHAGTSVPEVLVISDGLTTGDRTAL